MPSLRCSRPPATSPARAHREGRVRASEIGEPVPVSRVDLDGTRERRAWVYQQVRLRRHLLVLMSSSATDDCVVDTGSVSDDAAAAEAAG